MKEHVGKQDCDGTLPAKLPTSVILYMYNVVINNNNSIHVLFMYWNDNNDAVLVFESQFIDTKFSLNCLNNQNIELIRSSYYCSDNLLEFFF